LARAINLALADAGALPEEIGYISLDGLAVELWDNSEIKALELVFGNNLKKIPVSCPKSMFGNLLGASGALDMIIALKVMEYGLIPPTLNLDKPALNSLNYVAKEAKEYKVNKSLIISRGRGGINSVLVVEKA
jgi:3-oxoacyl-(acyl-carrier-protein) synthase